MALDSTVLVVVEATTRVRVAVAVRVTTAVRVAPTVRVTVMIRTAVVGGVRDASEAAALLGEATSRARASACPPIAPSSAHTAHAQMAIAHFSTDTAEHAAPGAPGTTRSAVRPPGTRGP